MKHQQQDSPESLIRFQQSLIVAARHVIDTFDRKQLELKEARLELDKRERELNRSFADAPGSIARAQKEIARLSAVVAQASGSGRSGPRRMMTDIERKLARRQAILAQLSAINDELGLVGAEDPA